VATRFLLRRRLRTTPTLKSLLAGSALGLFAAQGDCATAATAATPQPQPAVWMQHMLQVQLSNLPKNYSCYDLWYRFREVLQKIGARPDWKITTQGCVFSGNSQARSPLVELVFYFPEALPAAQAKWSDVKAVPSTVSLEPSSAPNSLDKSDCELVQQIKDGLLPALPVRVLEARIDCSSPTDAKHPYKVSIQTLTAVPTNGGTP
jgi:hypothetical protein